MLSVADSEPAFDGVKITDMEQFAPADTDAPQVFVCEKSAALAPLNVMPVIDIATALVFENITVCGELGVFTAT